MPSKKEKFIGFLYSIPRVLFVHFFKLFVIIKVANMENIPRNSSAVLAINHTTGADPIVLLGGMRKKIYFIASAKNFSTGFTDFFMRKFTNSLPIDKNNAAKNISTFKDLILISKKENTLFGIFPEGYLNKKGKLEQFHKGAAYLSLKTGLPLIPVYIHNLRKGVRPGSFIARSNVAEGIIAIIANTFHRINIVIGDPINPTAKSIVKDFKHLADSKSYRAAIDEVNDILSGEFSDLEEEADRLFSTS